MVIRILFFLILRKNVENFKKNVGNFGKNPTKNGEIENILYKNNTGYFIFPCAGHSV